MTKVFVSGAFNVLHAGHIQFFKDARALGDYLIVSFPPADLLWNLYNKKSVLEDADKLALLRSISYIDEVVLSTDEFNAVKHKTAYHPYEARKTILEAIRYVDEVIPEYTWEQKIQDVVDNQVDVFVMGDDWAGQFDFLKD